MRGMGGLLVSIALLFLVLAAVAGYAGYSNNVARA